MRHFLASLGGRDSRHALKAPGFRAGGEAPPQENGSDVSGGRPRCGVPSYSAGRGLGRPWISQRVSVAERLAASRGPATAIVHRGKPGEGREWEKIGDRLSVAPCGSPTVTTPWLDAHRTAHARPSVFYKKPELSDSVERISRPIGLIGKIPPMVINVHVSAAGAAPSKDLISFGARRRYGARLALRLD